MAFWDIFTEKQQTSNQSHLQTRLTELLPGRPERDLIMVACTAGLLARIAYIDFDVQKDEIEQMKSVLKKWTKLDDSLIKSIVEIAIDEITHLAGLENHLYCHPLNDILSNEEKYAILEALFAISASDGDISPEESEEIRIITKGLRLEHKHFISARATVLK